MLRDLHAFIDGEGWCVHHTFNEPSAAEKEAHVKRYPGGFIKVFVDSDKLEQSGAISEGHELAIKMLRADLKEASSKLPMWLKVSEREPDSRTRYVLAWLPTFPGGRECSFTINMRDDLWQYATHWMPLPEPPK